MVAAAVVFAVGFVVIVATYCYRRGHADGFAEARAGIRRGQTFAELPRVGGRGTDRVTLIRGD